MDITTVHTVNLRTVLSESKRILKTFYSHFSALSLFFLPLTFSLVITPTLHLHLSGNFFTVDFFHNFLANNQKVIIYHLLYIPIVYLLTLCAIGTISYSTYNIFIGRPVNYFAALNSLSFTFFPLFSTTILAQFLLVLVSLTFLLFVGVIAMLGKSLGFIIDHNSIYFMWFSMIIVTIIFFQMNWCLALMVVVVESKWGFEALMRSGYLVKGMRFVSFSLLLYYLIFNGLWVWVSWNTLYFFALSNDTQRVVLITIIDSFFMMMFLVASTAANSVFYTNCKAFHGELAHEIAEGFDYINLPSDDDKVPDVVTVEV